MLQRLHDKGDITSQTLGIGHNNNSTFWQRTKADRAEEPWHFNFHYHLWAQHHSQNLACRCASKERLVNSTFCKHIQTFYIRDIQAEKERLSKRVAEHEIRAAPHKIAHPLPLPKGLVKGLDVEAGGHLPVKIQAMQSAWIWMMWFNSAFSICQLPEWLRLLMEPLSSHQLKLKCWPAGLERDYAYFVANDSILVFYSRKKLPWMTLPLNSFWQIKAYLVNGDPAQSLPL